MLVQVTAEQETETFAASEAIVATLQHYIDGARRGDSALMRLAFADTSKIIGTYDGTAVEWTFSEFCDIVQKGGPAIDLEARIVGIEYTGNAAMARLEVLNWRGTRYTDFFLLTEQDGAWRIRSKVFFAHSRA